MERKQEIIFLYYEQGLIQTEIAEKLKVSKAYITKIIKKDARYEKEKQRRKDKNKLKNKVETKKYIKTKRNYNSFLYECMKKQHIQDRMEMSNHRSISNRAFKNWNSSIYEYDSNKKAYILKKGINVTKDVPKKIDWKIN